MCFNLSLDKWGKMYARLGRVYFASSTTLMQLQYVEKAGAQLGGGHAPPLRSLAPTCRGGQEVHPVLQFSDS